MLSAIRFHVSGTGMNGTGINKNKVTNNIHPVTAPIASGLEDKTNWIWKNKLEHEINVGLGGMQDTHIFGLDFLQRSMPDKFAAINISPRFWIEYFVVKYAHIENTQFMPNVTPILRNPIASDAINLPLIWSICVYFNRWKSFVYFDLYIYIVGPFDTQWFSAWRVLCMSTVQIEFVKWECDITRWVVSWQQGEFETSLRTKNKAFRSRELNFSNFTLESVNIRHIFVFFENFKGIKLVVENGVIIKLSLALRLIRIKLNQRIFQMSLKAVGTQRIQTVSKQLNRLQH